MVGKMLGWILGTYQTAIVQRPIIRIYTCNSIGKMAGQHSGQMFFENGLMVRLEKCTWVYKCNNWRQSDDGWPLEAHII